MFTICIPILNQHDEAVKHLDSWFALAKGSLDVLFIDNGSDTPFNRHPAVSKWQLEGHRVWVHRNSENTGVYPTFQQGFEMLCNHQPFIFYSHSDVEMVVPGWDVRLRELLEVAASRNVGACGMFGAKGLGLLEIYITSLRNVVMG